MLEIGDTRECLQNYTKAKLKPKKKKKQKNYKKKKKTKRGFT